MKISLKLKAFLFCIIFTLVCNAQPKDSYSTPLIYKDFVSSEFIVGTNALSPLVGISLQRYVYDDKFNFYIPLQLGFYQHTFEKPNFLYLQMGAAFQLSKKLDLGFNLINLQAQLPRPINIDSYGYDNPFSTYLCLKNSHYKNSFVKLEYSYSFQFERSAFRIIFKQNLYEIPHLPFK